MNQMKRYILIGIILSSLLPQRVLATEALVPVASVGSQVAVPDQAALEAEKTPGSLLVGPTDGTSTDASAPGEPTVVQAAPEQLAANLPTSIQAPPPPPDVIQLSPAPIAANADVIVSGFEVVSGRLVALELRNMTSDVVDISRWTVHPVYASDGEERACAVELTGYLTPKQSFTLTQTGSVIMTDWPADARPYERPLACPEAPGALVSIEVVETAPVPPLVVERIDYESAGQMVTARDGRWVRRTTTTTVSRTGVFTQDFPRPLGGDTSRPLFYSQPYQPPASAPFEITEIYITPKSCAPSDQSLACQRYVKIRSHADEVIELGRYRLRAGSPLSGSTSVNTTPLHGQIQPGAVLLIAQSTTGSALYLGADEGAVWFEDQYGFRSYHQDSDVTPYKGAATVSHTGLSWALDDADGTWKWSLPSLVAGGNDIRIPVPEPVSVPQLEREPCRTDQYRSPDTNRCRSTETAQVGLTPCKAGQYRSEETNRCRSLVAAGAERKPCTDTQYRSPETNRCRNKVAASVPTAGFAVEPIADSKTTFVGWWLIAGVGAVALGYGAWEWRREVASAARWLGSVFSRRK